MSTVRLHGEDAIQYAKQHNLSLNTKADSAEPVRTIGPEDAEVIAREHPEDVWIEIDKNVNTGEPKGNH